jgi:hypothetical protein
MIKILFPSALLIFLFSCKNVDNSDLIQISVYPDSIINTMQEGIGCNFHAIEGPLATEQLSHALRSYGGSAWGANPDVKDSASWNKLFEYADWLGFDWCRIGIQYQTFEPEKNKFTFDGHDMKVLCRYLDYCQSRNIDVFLQHYWINAAWLAPDSFRKDPVKVIRSMPNDIEAYTDGFIKLLKYLIEEKKYTCIKQFCITNEPFENWSWYMKSFNPEKYESPAPAYRLMAKKLKDNKISVQLSGPDCSIYAGKPMGPQQDDFFKVLDAYDLHSYVTRFDWNPDSTMIFEGGGVGQIDRISDFMEYLKPWEEDARKNNKPFLFTEMGTMSNGFGGSNPGVALYKSLLKDVQLVLRFSQFGMDGFARWNFVNRGNLDGPWQMVDTWDTAKQSLLPANEFRPHANNYYMWGLLTRFTAKGSNVVKTTVDGGCDGKYQRVFATAYCSPKNKNLSIYITNDSDQGYETIIKLNGQSVKLFKYEINEQEHKDKADINLVPSETVENKTEIKVSVKPKSILLFTSYDLKNIDQGIIED